MLLNGVGHKLFNIWGAMTRTAPHESYSPDQGISQ